MPPFHPNAIVPVPHRRPPQRPDPSSRCESHPARARAGRAGHECRSARRRWSRRRPRSPTARARCPAGERVAHDRIDGHADRERVRQHDRRFDRAELADLRRSGELAERISNEYGAGNLVRRRRSLRAARSPSRQLDAVAFDDRRVTDAYARDVSDRIQRARRPTRRRQCRCPARGNATVPTSRSRSTRRRRSTG